MKAYPPATIQRARDLYASGLGYTLTGRELGVPPTTIRRWVKPDIAARFAKASLERKQRYAGECRKCGARTNGSNGPGTASHLCWHCFSGATHLIWTSAAIIEAMKAWVDEYGTPPSANDWRWTERAWPPVGSVQARFGSWAAGIRAAGYEPNRAGTPSHGKSGHDPEKER